MHNWLQDLRLGLRMLLKNPETTGVAIAAMAIAIAATSTTFSVINGVLLQPLPFHDPQRLVAIWQIDKAAPQAWRSVAAGNFADWRQQSTSFSSMVAGVNRSFTLSSFENPETPLMRQVSAGYFETLGVAPLLGRTFLPAEDQPAAAPVMMLSYDLWQSRFGADPNVIGTSTELDGQPFEIIGVMPQGYDNPLFGNVVPPQAWIPLGLPATSNELDRRGNNHLVIARLKPGVSVEQARQELVRISMHLGEIYPETNRSIEALVTPAKERLVRGIRPQLLMLFGAVLFVLLVACGNVANLLLTRALGRQREMAVRRALGAGLGHLLRQLIVESLLLTGLCGVLGLLLAAWGTSALSLLMPDGFRASGNPLSIDGNVLLFTLGIVLLTGLVFGLVPAVHAARSQLEKTLHTGALRATGGRQSRRLQGVLVVSEVALCLVLLIGAGLMGRSFARLQAMDPGFAPDHLLTFRVSTRGPEYQEGERREAFFRRVEEGIATIPGVTGVGVAQALPFFPQFLATPVTLDAAPPPEPGSEVRVGMTRVTPSFLATMKVPLLQGRFFDSRDTAEAPAVALVSGTMARLLWGDASPLGTGITIADAQGISRQVVGIVGDVRTDSVPPEPQPMLYVPLAQDPAANSVAYVVRTAGDPLGVLDAVKREVAAVDRGMPVYVVNTVDSMIATMDWRPRFILSLLSIFALLALALATTGIYAVLSYGVSQRTREIGIRMALGARRSEVLRMVLRGGLRLAAVGIAAGIAGALGCSQLLRSELYGITSTDPATYAALALLLATIVLGASYIPARRATRVDPVVALGEE